MRRIIGLAGAAALLAAALAPGASAAPQQRSGAPSEWQTFGTGQWRPHAGYESQHGLVTTSDASGSYGGISLLAPPASINDLTAASFDFNADQTGPSGGSPRLVILFTDRSGTSQAYLRPNAWTADTWTHLDGMSSNDWDSTGGSCGFQYQTTFAQVKACHQGEPITAVFAVNDSGWLYPAGEQVVLDNVTLNGAVATGPGNSR